MRSADRIIQGRRIAQAVRFVRPGSKVFDIGCDDGSLFRALGARLREGVGIDAGLAGTLEGANYALRPGYFPRDAYEEPETFDAVSALAVLEHVPPTDLQDFAAAISRLLVPGGEAILTVPAPAVDLILHALISIQVLDGMEADAHHGFDLAQVEPLFTGAGLSLERHHRFQLGLNHLYVFRKESAAD